MASAVLEAIDDKAALLSVDDVLVRTLVRPRTHMWDQIPLAYELLEPQAVTLLERGWNVVFDSTFTFVPDRGEARFYGDVLKRIVACAADVGTPCLVVQLTAARETLERRASRTGRLTPEVVRATEGTHARPLVVDAPLLRLRTDDEDPSALAERVLAELCALAGEGHS